MEIHSEITDEILGLKEYISQVGRDYVNNSALYIVEALLTKLQTMLSPKLILRSLFTPKTTAQLAQMLANEEGATGESRCHQEGHACGESQLLSHFRITLKKVEVVPSGDNFYESALLLNQIYETLEEWQIIERRASELTARIKDSSKTEQTMARTQTNSDSLQTIFNKIITQTEETNYSEESIELHEVEVLTTESLNSEEVVSFVEYVSMWLSHLLQEIVEFKSILLFTKEDSSNGRSSGVFQSEKLQVLKIRNRFLKTKKKHRQSLLTEVLRAGQDTTQQDGNQQIQMEPVLNQNFCLKPKQRTRKEYSVKLNKKEELEQKDSRRATSEQQVGKIDAGQEMKHRKKQIKFKAKERPCAECTIY